MAEVGTVETTRYPVLHDEQGERATTAAGAVPFPQRLLDDKPGEPRGSCAGCHDRILPPDRPRATFRTPG
ncbi:hypothetical protein GCM10010297_08780 [Streptomyces malachitofuscus]|nr:hypothetical protein GCM10010297_08780 [Streptomyces malachitofuscus]